ncbi:MAG TPA: HGGxSTG domain-containing protein [Acetobacteraceae bacterium]
MSNGPHAPGWAIAQRAAQAAPRCGARTRRCTPCAGPAMANGRCRMHGGASHGPVTAAGLERCRQARLKHGGRGAEARQAARERGEARKVLAALNGLLRGL